MPCYLPIMQFAHSSALREQALQSAYATRASDQSEAVQKLTNQIKTIPPWVKEILALRQEEAQPAGLRLTSPQVSLVRQDGRSRPAEVMAFLRDLAVSVPALTQKKMWPRCVPLLPNALEHHQDPLNAWDWPYLG
jgi:oligopeptidase A